ncbi:putative serine/threonine-protein kinase/receptor R818 [Phytophthora ramorum]|uniref:putative serine/threonine-protein kinase/receptor R818 n=1 Tax=Phytophthora ramorum TaxID=164328 RepID=UPI0030B732AD|nr:putative serine/threonine-protein kinase/receptor R818 [Phytophthora ramorum]
MRNVVLRRRRGKLQLLAVSAALSLGGNVVAQATSSGSDILARCEGLQSDTAVLTAPTDADLPSDVASTLSAHSEVTWSDLDDVAKVGLLWAHGYVFSGGSSNGDKAGDAILEVYTRCSEGAATGVTMADVEVSYDDFTGQASQCDAASCGSYYQATNTNCVANVTSAIQCAVDGASATVQTASSVSFWSSAASSSTIPYPQVFQHGIALSDETKALQVYSIHMRNSDVGTSCGNTLDAIIPCLRMEDLTSSRTSSSSGASGFCKPAVDAATVSNFLALASTIPVDKQSDDSSSQDGGSNMALILGAGIGGGVLFVIMLVICCCCRKKEMQNTEHPSETAAIGTAPEQTESQTSSAIRSGLGFIPRVIGRRRKSNDSSSDISSDAATNVNVQTNRGRRSSWYTFGNASNRESTAYGRRSSMAGTWVGATGGGKTVSEYCNESEILTTFMQDPEVFTKRIAFDELTFLRMLSKGAYGEVWLGQLETGHVAIKRLLPEKCQFTASLEQFAGEIQLMCTLQHRNVVSFVGVSWNRLQNLCAVVEYMEAGDLDEVLKKNRDKFSWQREKISIAMDVAEGLVYLHCLRPVVVHRDLKSKNVLLNRKFHAKLSDFGVSRKTHVNETMTSGVGTLLWTAPEIIEGKKYSEKADIYSLGVVLSEMDTCEPPFSDVTSDKGERLPGMQLAQLVRLGKIRVSLRQDCPPNLRKLVMDCTQLDPDARPSSMQVAFTLKSIIAPTLRMSSSTATTASSSSTISGSHATAGQALQRPSPSVKGSRMN